MGEPTTVDPRAGAAPAPVFKLQSLEFRSDHQLLKDCRSESGWRNAGAPCPAPEWTPGAVQPVSLTMDQRVLVRLTVAMTEGAPRAATIVLHGQDTAGLEFVHRGLMPTPGFASFDVASVRKIERKIQKVELTIRWSMVGAGGPAAPESTSNPVYVTMGRPRVDQQGFWPEDGVSLKRMDRAVAWVGALGSLDPHQIVNGLMAKFPSYSLKPSPKVPREYRHPTYFNEQGGAWSMSDFVPESGECQAIVRLVRGVLRQVGVPGRARVVVIWADPNAKGGKTALSADLEEKPSAGLDTTKVVDGRRWLAALVDAPVEEGKTYPASHTDQGGGKLSPGLNRFEACLEFTHGGKTRYYAAGSGSEGVYEDKQRILEVFWGLIWVSFMPGDGYRVEKIVARYGAVGGAP